MLEHIDVKKYRNLYVSTVANSGLIALLLSQEPLLVFSFLDVFEPSLPPY